MARMASVGETIEREVGRILERDPASTPSVLPEAQAAAKYVASFVQSSIFPAGSPKEVKDLVDAIRGLRRRRLFCEATFRSELRKNSLSCGILLSWELSRCGVLTWWDHLPSVWAEPEGVLGLEREAAGGVLERLVRDSGDLEEGEDRHRDLRSLEALNAVRGLWREPGRDRRAYRLLSALDATRSAFPEPLHRGRGAGRRLPGGPPQRCPGVPLRAEGRDCWGSWPRRGRDGGPRGRRGDGDPGGIVAG